MRPNDFGLLEPDTSPRLFGGLEVQTALWIPAEVDVRPPVVCWRGRGGLRDPRTGTLLWDFIGISRPGGARRKPPTTEDRIAAFVRNWGPLAVYPSPSEDGWEQEGLGIYADLSGMLRAYLSIAADLAAENRTSGDDWGAVVGTGSNLERPPAHEDRHGQRRLLAWQLSRLIANAHVSPWVMVVREDLRIGLGPLLAPEEQRTWDRDAKAGRPPTVAIMDWRTGQEVQVWRPRPSPLFAALVTRLVETITAPRFGLFRCTECQALHERGKAPRKGAPGLCPDCRKVASVQKTQAWRERKAEALRMGGVPGA